MRKEFVMRGKTASDQHTAVGKSPTLLNFGKYKAGYAYKMTEFKIYPSTGIGAVAYELSATVTAAKTFEDPENPNFENEGLIATAFLANSSTPTYTSAVMNSIVNDTFLITQNLILAAIDTQSGSPMDINWQCRFESVKMTGPEEASTNFKQFSISDG